MTEQAHAEPASPPGEQPLRRLDPEAEAARARPVGPQVLVVDDDQLIIDLVTAFLESDGLEVIAAGDGREALARIAEARPDLVLCDVVMPRMGGLEFLHALRGNVKTEAIPVIMLTARGATKEVVAALRAGADDYVRKPFSSEELLARVWSKLERRPVPAQLLEQDPRTALRTERALREDSARELDRAKRAGRPGCLAMLELAELQRVRIRLGSRAGEELLGEVAAEVARWLDPLDSAAKSGSGTILLLLPETPTDVAEQRLEALSELLSERDFIAGGDRVRLTPAIGFTGFGARANATDDVSELVRRARVAADAATARLDVRPRHWSPEMDLAGVEPRRTLRSLLQHLGTPFQILMTQLAGLILPFLAYWALDSGGVDVTSVAYWAVVFALLVTAANIWIEGFLALRAPGPPPEPGAPYPPATAIIAAYLPNETDTILETVEAFLAVDYPAGLQIILAYNTPHPHPLERTLHKYADRHPNFMPLRVMFSESKAQNINGALSEATGDFDADHKPSPDAFRRAWRWLSNGNDVVQGHCVIRNGAADRLSRIVAVEFESIYAVFHPGRAMLHGFGIFGGSNGFWRSDVLRRIRMRDSMLTEDIDSSMRVVESGGRIAADRGLFSHELAPTRLGPLWNQRLRWAQGWLQVSIVHLPRALRSSALSLRQKIGALYLFGWREVYPWISLQMFPILAYWLFKYGPTSLNWLIPLFVLTTLFTLSTGPGQTVFAYHLAAPDIKRHRSWFLLYLVAASIFYTELKNVITRVAHVKELLGEQRWKVTPRTARSTPATK